MAATVLCASAAKSDKTHTHPETAEQERKQTLSTKRGPGGSARLPRLAAHGGLPGPGSHRLPLRKPSSGWGPGAEEEMTARGQRTRRCAHPRLLASRPDARARLLLAPVSAGSRRHLPSDQAIVFSPASTLTLSLSCFWMPEALPSSRRAPTDRKHIRLHTRPRYSQTVWF